MKKINLKNIQIFKKIIKNYNNNYKLKFKNYNNKKKIFISNNNFKNNQIQNGMI